MSRLENMTAERMKAIKKSMMTMMKNALKVKPKGYLMMNKMRIPRMMMRTKRKPETSTQMLPNILTQKSQKEFHKKDQLRVKTERRKRPRNVRYVREVQINNPIYYKLGSYTRKRDAGFRAIQGLVSKAIIAMAKTAQSVICMQKEDGED